MEYDSGSSCEERLKDLEDSKQHLRSENQAERENCKKIESPQWYGLETAAPRQTRLPTVSKRSLSAQVMEYYHKYSQNSSLGRYFSLPEPGVTSDGTNYHQRTYGSIPEVCINRESYIVLAAEERSRLDSSTPRERRRWARPPLIGQPSTSDAAVASTYVGVSSTDSRTPSPISKRPMTETIPEERNESRETLTESKDTEIKPSTSPTSSVASHKPLEWDSGADVGYYNAQPLSKEKDKKLCTIERMALARGRSAAMRLDPEGTNESTSQKTTTSSRTAARNSMKPDANSTPLVGHFSGESESEIEITPIVKNHLPGIMVGSEERARTIGETGTGENGTGKFKTKSNQGAPPVQIKYPTEGSRSKEMRQAISSLKKSSSMNLLALPLSRLSLKRSQSELNLRGREKKMPLPPLIFDSTSSIATVVNKPTTCDKFIQTSLDGCSRESIGIQVEVRDEMSEKSNDDLSEETDDNVEEEEEEEKEEEKPPLPKRASSLAPKSLHSILKNSSNTYNIRARHFSRSTSPTGNTSKDPEKLEEENHPDNEDELDGSVEVRTRGGGRTEISSNPSRNESSSTPSEIVIEDTTGENTAGRASNSFEYFPGYVYQNVPNGHESRASSIEPGRESRCSTMPNTSSSIDEKLWGDSDSLVRDLERSVNILKSLVDANKCDKQVKKRLIHHVIKRLVTAKYTDDRIEHDLEENVPWNPADARNKVYRNDIIQALANKHNTTDSSADDWRPRKRSVACGNLASPKKTIAKETRIIKGIMNLAGSSRGSTNSDKFPFDRHTDRTVMDGRKARMGLRSEDRRRETDPEKSESSECFLPASHKIKSTNVFYSVEKTNEKGTTTPCSITRAPVTSMTTTTTTTSTMSATSQSTSRDDPISSRIVLVKERRRTESNETDWRLPTTMSERRFELGRCSNSECGDVKLINYAEMEKRNQLVWITNEISHLCNLKRLLEEPNKTEVRSRGTNSPRKRSAGAPIDQWIVRAHTERNSSRRTCRARGTGSEAAAEDIAPDESLKKTPENQWSSHGNLASCRSDRQTPGKRDDNRTDRVGQMRKRNSCTQTGSDGGPSGHSKTGGEIVSATLPVFVSATFARVDREITLEMRDASVQTREISPEMNKNGISACTNVSPESGTKIAHSPTCHVQSQPNGAEKTQKGHVCYCQRYAAHSRHKACIMHSPQKCSREHSKNCPQRSTFKDDERPIITQEIPLSNACMDSRKETKNQLNATCKSKYAIRELPGKCKNRCGRCGEEKNSMKASVPVGRMESLAGCSKGQQNGVTEIWTCQSNGNKSDGKDEEEIETSPSETGNDVEEKGRRPRCTCRLRENSWINREIDGAAGAKDTRRKIQSDEAKNVEKTCKSCRTCGTIWPIRDGKNANRGCKCFQDYLKPVAYELKFDEETKEKRRNMGRTKSRKIDKILTKDLPTNLESQSKASHSCTISDDEEKNENGDEDKCPGTLKDFLATNKPEFLENVETRRRYMSEISQLRQLKREKRKQFLAMSGPSGFLKPQRTPKGSTANGQKKLSDYEMKVRLRMRYLRLNEVRNKRLQREKEEEAKRNHLMAKLFGQKLQQKVLRGQVDLSQSVSVISNL